jgi:hypothetical protein
MEGGRLRVPAARLHARDGDNGDFVWRRQDGQIEHAILLGAEQFFAVEQQDSVRRVVLQLQFGNRPAVRQFCDLSQALRHGVFGEQIVGFGAVRSWSQERKQR